MRKVSFWGTPLSMGWFAPSLRAVPRTESQEKLLLSTLSIPIWIRKPFDLEYDHYENNEPARGV